MVLNTPLWSNPEAGREYDVIGGELIPRFTDMEAAYKYFYAPLYNVKVGEFEQSLKVDAPILTSTGSTVFSALRGKKVWDAIATEFNIVRALGKRPWEGRKLRLITNLNRPASSGISETAAPPDSIKSTYNDTFNLPPKIHVDVFEISQLFGIEQAYEDAINAVDEETRGTELRHMLNINERLLKDFDTLAGDNIESIDRVISSASEENGVGATDGDADYAGFVRDTETYFDAVVKHNSNVDREYTLALLDNTFQSVWSQGQTVGGLTVKPNLIFSKYDVFVRTGQILEGERRFLGNGEAVADVNGIRSIVNTGVEGAFHVKTYNEAPWLQDDTAAGDTIGRVYVMNTDYIWLSVAKPTSVIDDGLTLTAPNPWLHNKFAKKSGLQTIMELKCPVPRVQAKLRDLQ